MKKIVAAFTIIAISLASCGTNYEPAVVSGFLIEQIDKWIGSQKQYFLINAKVGSDAEIGYKFESVNKEMGPKLLASYFKQETIIDENLATFKITAKKNIGDCKNGVWTILHNAANPANPYRVVIEGENCEALIPNLCNYASSRKCGMEEVKDPAEEAKAELEAAAEKWVKEEKVAANTNIFTFAKEGYEELRIWKATSKVKIGGCPAKSVWELKAEGCLTDNKPPKNKNCSPITPKVITDYKGHDGCQL